MVAQSQHHTNHIYTQTYTFWLIIGHLNDTTHPSRVTYTGRFIMYTGITKIYYRKTVRHVFTKPVQIEGTTHDPKEEEEHASSHQLQSRY